MRIMITGGNGYVGRELVRLLAGEHDLCVIDNFRYGINRIDDDLSSRIRVERIDIESGPALGRVMEDFRPQVVIHLAAVHYIPECDADPAAAVRTNVVGTVNALSTCPPGCRFVFASSGAVYAPDAKPHDEEHSAIGPMDIYGLTKLDGEEYVRLLARSRGLAAGIVRLFNVIGPGETNPHLLAEIVAQLKAGRDSVRLGNLWPKRDYIHVCDAARGFAAVALRGEIGLGETVTVNLGTSHSYSVMTVLRRLRRISGQDFAIEEDKARRRTVDRPHLAARRARIRQRFGWKPSFSIDEALADLWANPDLAAALTKRYAPSAATLPRDADVANWITLPVPPPLTKSAAAG